MRMLRIYGRDDQWGMRMSFALNPAWRVAPRYSTAPLGAALPLTVVPSLSRDLLRNADVLMRGILIPHEIPPSDAHAANLRSR